MKNRSLSALFQGKLSLSNFMLGKARTVAASTHKQSFGKTLLCGLLLGGATLGLTACHSNLFLAYKFPAFPFANRPVPPSKLANRVMIAVSNVGLGGGSGSLAIVDALRDIRSNIQNTNSSFSISAFSAANPTNIYSFPEQLTGYVYATGTTGPSLTTINYGTEAAGGTPISFPAPSSAIAIPTDFVRFFSAEESSGQLVIADSSTSKQYALNLPNVYQVAANVGDTVALAMVRNSNTLYQVVKLNTNQYLTLSDAAKPPSITGGKNTGGISAVDCQPVNLPVYCVVPVPGNYDRPVGAYFSVDGSTAYILNCGPECGGNTASVTFLQQGALNINNVSIYGVPSGTATAPSGSTNPPGYITNVPVPGGVTTALSDGATLYVAGQQLQPDGLFAGNLSTITLSSNTVSGKYSISDGNHTKLLFADDNTLWIGSQFCATGERFKLNQNYNCLTRFDTSAKTAAIVPNVTPGGATQVPFPNTNLNPYYYGDLTGLCWVQGLHKVYTAYGGQVHLFSTTDGSEIDNSLVTVQGTALDVAYLDAESNTAN